MYLILCILNHSLNYIHGLPDEANIGAISLHQLFDCDMKEAVMTTYKVDIFWLLNKHPKLQQIPVHICHGESHQQVMLATSEY